VIGSSGLMLIDSRNQAHRVDEGFPGRALAGEDAAAYGFAEVTSTYRL